MGLEKLKSMQAVTKKNKKNNKLGKVKLPRKDTNNIVNPDLSNLRKPIDTSISTLYQIAKLLENSTEEIKSILSYECDIVYECRICRSLFRSIVNLISHKREYCREKFDVTVHKNVWNDRNTISAIGSVIHAYQTEQRAITNNLTNDRILRSQVPKETRKRDLTAVIDNLIKKKEEDMRSNCSNESELQNTFTEASSNQHIYLEAISTNNSAVYQTVKSSNTVASATDLIAKETVELQNTIDQKSTVLEGKHLDENQVEKSENPIQADINGEEDKLLADKTPTDSLICTICHAKFATKKTLTFHVKTLHTTQRVCYTCPCCTSTFANTWSVHRHLFKVHRKTHEQVRKLRLQIQEIAFDREAAIMQDLKKSRTTRTLVSEKLKHNNDLRNSDEAQERTSLSECDAEDSSCNGCGKKFDTKAALSAHSQYCSAPIAVRDEVATKLDQSDGSSSDSVLSNNTLCELANNDAVADSSTEKSPTAKDASDVNFKYKSSDPEIIEEESYDITIRVEDVSTLSNEDWDMLECHSNNLLEGNLADNNELPATTVPSTVHKSIENIEQPTVVEQPLYEGSENLQLLDVVHQDTSETGSMDLEIIHVKRNTLLSHNEGNNEKQPIDSKGRDIEVQQDGPQSQPSCLIQPKETEQTLSIQSKIAEIANLRKLQCLLCKRKFTSLTSLRRHMAFHIGWYRYRCKLCDFKCFFKCDCVTHCNKIHNTQNDRALIAEIVVEMPQVKYECNKDVVTNANAEKKTDDPDIAKRTASSSQPERYEGADDSSGTNARVVQSEGTTRTKGLVTDLCGDVQYENVITEDTDKTTTVCTNLEEYMACRNPGKLDAHPDVKRMVMEVILGSNDANSAVKQEDSEKKIKLDINEAGGDTRNNENSTVAIDASSTTYTALTEGSKFQRPLRKRIKPLNKDFVYDLKDMQFRKETCKSSSLFQLGKTSTKHRLNFCESETLINARKKVKLYKKTLQAD